MVFIFNSCYIFSGKIEINMAFKRMKNNENLKVIVIIFYIFLDRSYLIWFIIFRINFEY